MKQILAVFLLLSVTAFAADNPNDNYVLNRMNDNLISINTNTGSAPTGGSTAALQSNVQANAGSDASKVISVQGVTSGKAIPVSLASVPTHAVTQSGTWIMQPGNTANTTAWLIRADSLPLPTGAATETSLSNVGSILGDIFTTVNGIGSETGNIDSSTSGISSTVNDISSKLDALASIDTKLTSPITVTGSVSTSPFVTGLWGYAAASGGITNTTTAVTIKAAGGGSVVNYIQSMQISADALGVATEVVIRKGAGGTVIWRGKISTAGLAPSPVVLLAPLPSDANQLLEAATLTATVTGGVYINAQGVSY